MRMLALLLIVIFSTSAFAQDVVYCNGQRTNIAGDVFWPNGKRVFISGDYFYPNGNRVMISGDLLYPNNGRMNILQDEYYMSGNRVLVANDLFYPNNQRVKISGECYFQNGVKMSQCPDSVRYKDSRGNFTIIGSLSLIQNKISSQNFVFKEGAVTTYFSVTKKGAITDIEAVCE